MKKIFILIVMAIISHHSAYAEVKPKSMSADTHIKIVNYDPNNVVTVQGRYGYQTQITFSPNEKVQNVSIGDSMAWQVVPVNNHLFIKPTTESTTNMTVLTNTNSYNFKLDSTDTKISPIYKLQFNYSPGGYESDGSQNAVANFDPEKINWKYSFTGDKSIVPTETFDNGQFTYFKFKNDGMSRLPAIFIVDKERNETLVNYHIQGSYLIVNSVAKQFTLRNGKYVTSIYNDLAIGDWKSI